MLLRMRVVLTIILRLRNRIRKSYLSFEIQEVENASNDFV